MGNWIAANGSTTRCWQSARGSAREAVARRTRILRGARTKYEHKMSYLQRVVWPAISFRAASWAPTPAMEQEIDRFLRWAVAQATGAKKRPGEDVGAFLRRRAKAVARTIPPGKGWGRQCAISARRMYDRMRDERAGRWPHELAWSQNAEWLRERRLAEGSASSSAGRLGVRAAIGRVAPRLSEYAPRAPTL